MQVLEARADIVQLAYGQIDIVSQLQLLGDGQGADGGEVDGMPNAR